MIALLGLAARGQDRELPPSRVWPQLETKRVRKEPLRIRDAAAWSSLWKDLQGEEARPPAPLAADEMALALPVEISCCRPVLHQGLEAKEAGGTLRVTLSVTTIPTGRPHGPNDRAAWRTWIVVVPRSSLPVEFHLREDGREARKVGTAE